MTNRARMVEWLLTAHKIARAAFPTINFALDGPDIQQAQNVCDEALYSHFYESGSLDNLRATWRNYYLLLIPGQRSLL